MKRAWVCNPELRTVKKGWQGNPVVDGRFCDVWGGRKPSLWSAVKWKLGGNPQAAEKRCDTFRPASVAVDGLGKDEDCLVWLGHSSFYISVNGAGLLTDPCLMDLPVARRWVKLPCDIERLDAVDFILISHNHRDHLDKRSIRRVLACNREAGILAPLGVKRVLGMYNVQEAGWWQEYATGRDVKVVFLPARHWSRRGLNDYNKVLWGSFMIVTGVRKIFFAGDSAYNRDMFREIRSQFGDVDLCLLPIGAYAPAWFMSGEHMNPEEAFSAFLDLGGRRMVPMHYGTYDLSDEPMGEPIARLRAVAADNGCRDRVVELAVGEKLLF